MKTTCTLLFTILSFAAFSQGGEIRLDENYNDQGARINITTEDSERYFIAEPDINGDGAFFQLIGADGNIFAGLIWDGSDNDGNSGVLSVSGDSSAFQFDTRVTGDESLLLPNSSVNSTEILNETGVVHQTNNNLSTITTSSTVLESVTITIPSDGYILVMANGQLNINHTNGLNDFAELGISEDLFLTGVQDVAVGVASASPSGFYYIPGAVHGLFEKPAGTYTFNYIGRLNSSSGNSSMNDAKMTAIFIPTNYGAVAGELQGDDNQQLDSFTPSESSNYSQADLKDKRNASILANQKRMQKEIDELKAYIEKLPQPSNGPSEE